LDYFLINHRNMTNRKTKNHINNNKKEMNQQYNQENLLIALIFQPDLICILKI
jgi:hypothetical protein